MRIGNGVVSSGFVDLLVDGYALDEEDGDSEEEDGDLDNAETTSEDNDGDEDSEDHIDNVNNAAHMNDDGDDEVIVSETENNAAAIAHQRASMGRMAVGYDDEDHDDVNPCSIPSRPLTNHSVMPSA